MNKLKKHPLNQQGSEKECFQKSRDVFSNLHYKKRKTTHPKETVF
jgi:hypothetical protein